jgi:hypothetical protein
VTGVLLLIAAAIHLLVTPTLKRVILDRVLTPEELLIVSPPFLLNHIVMGILLIPIGFVTIYCASGIRAGERCMGHQPCQRADHSKFADRACLGDAAGTFPIHRVSDWRLSDYNRGNHNDGRAGLGAT